MPFDASIAARDPDIPARSPTAHDPRPMAAGQALSPGVALQGVTPGACPSPYAMPYYSVRHPRPVSAIAPRLSRGVI